MDTELPPQFDSHLNKQRPPAIVQPDPGFMRDSGISFPDSQLEGEHLTIYELTGLQALRRNRIYSATIDGIQIMFLINEQDEIQFYDPETNAAVNRVDREIRELFDKNTQRRLSSSGRTIYYWVPVDSSESEDETASNNPNAQSDSIEVLNPPIELNPSEETILEQNQLYFYVYRNSSNELARIYFSVSLAGTGMIPEIKIYSSNGQEVDSSDSNYQSQHDSIRLLLSTTRNSYNDTTEIRFGS
jgi:hypothetical protein